MSKTDALTRESLEAKFAEKFPKVEKHSLEVKNYLTLKLNSAEDLPEVVAWLKNDMGFDYLDMITGVDWHGEINLDGFIRDPNPNVFLPDGATPQTQPPKKMPNVEYRDSIELVYAFSNLSDKLKVFLKVDVPRDGGSAPTLSGEFKTADWQEREVFDLLGVSFAGHPNLKKILTPDFIEGYPLRKDYVHKKDRFD